MNKLVVTLFVLSFASIQVRASDGIEDRVVFDAAGHRTVIRAVENAGRADQVDQRLKVMSDGRLRYDYNEQSESTKEYHRSYCELIGMQPLTDGEVLFDSDASGWHCSNVRELHPDELAELQRFPLDYVHAVAPSGSVQSHTNFKLEASAHYQSSVAGSMRGVSHVDNRCRSEFSQYYGFPFKGDHRAKVTCRAHEPRFLNSGMEACVPNKCGRASGTVSVR